MFLADISLMPCHRKCCPLAAIATFFMMKFNISFLFIIFLAACSHGQNKYLPEATVLKIIEKKYDSLRTSLRDSLASNISSVNDYNRAFTSEENVQLDILIKDFKKQTGLQLVVFTLDSLMTSKDSVHEVTQIIGIKNQINTTVGISFPYRDMFIWNDSLVNNTVLDKNETKTIINEKFFPSFRKGDYFIGTFEGIKAIMQRINYNRKYKGLNKNGG